VESALDVPKVRVTGISILILLTIPIAANILLSGNLPACMMVIYQTISAKINEKKEGMTYFTICEIRSQVSLSDFSFLIRACEVVSLYVARIYSKGSVISLNL